MPTSERHLEQATHNEALLSLVAKTDNTSRFSDWYVTISFYAALHYVEALIFSTRRPLRIGPEDGVRVKGNHSSDFLRFLNSRSDHHARNTVIRANPDRFEKIIFPYLTLYEMSRVARYDCHSPHAHDYPEAEKHLDTIRNQHKKLTKTKR